MNLENLERSEHLKRTHLEHVQHCTNLPLRVTFPAYTEHGKRFGINVSACQEKEKKEKTGKREAGNERKQANDFKYHRVAFLQPFTWQHGEKIVCVRGVPGVT